MAITYDLKIKELEEKKSELDLLFLLSKKQEYQEKIYKILDSQNNTELDGNSAISQLSEAKSYYEQIKEIEQKIQNNSKLLEDIDNKIAFYQGKKDKVKDIPLYKDTEEGIAEILGSDALYQYAKETKNEGLIKKLENRTLTCDEYSKAVENMYNDLFASSQRKKNKKSEVQQAPKVVILLPEGMSDQIREELKNNKGITPQDIESFLKKELKKNSGEIKLSHIKNTFKDKANQAYEYIRRLIINYPGFKIIDNPQKRSSTFEPSKREKLISQIMNKETDETEICRVEKEKEKISKLSEIGKIENTEERISAYVELYEEVGCKFSDKQKFLEQLIDVIKSQTHIQLDNAIQDNLSKIIQIDLKPEKTGGKGYLSYKLSPSFDARRIIAYPNGEIFTISSHDEYEEIISKKPPVDKRRK